MVHNLLKMRCSIRRRVRHIGPTGQSRDITATRYRIMAEDGQKEQKGVRRFCGAQPPGDNVRAPGLPLHRGIRNQGVAAARSA
jgi:hypothetical protein